MRYLLDTHAFLWWIFDDPKLLDSTRQIIADPDNEVFVSSASAWEIATKYRIGKLDAARVLVQDISGWVQKAGFKELPVSTKHAQKAGTWSNPHRDPFDRILAAQSAIEELQVITIDKQLNSFGITTIWT